MTVALVSPSICFDLSNRTKASEDRPFPSKEVSNRKRWTRWRHLPSNFFDYSRQLTGITNPRSRSSIDYAKAYRMAYQINGPSHHYVREKTTGMSELHFTSGQTTQTEAKWNSKIQLKFYIINFPLKKNN